MAWIRKLLLVAFTGLNLLSCEFIGENVTDDRDEVIGMIDQLLEKNYADGHFNGVALVAYGDTVYMKATGMSNHRANLNMKVDHVFYLGSLAKQFTGMAVMLLEADGKLAFDDKVVSYVPELPQFCSEITIRQLLNHTSGLPDYYEMGLFKSGMTNQMVVEGLRGISTLEFEPGTKYNYSNSGYVLLSVIIERVSGISYGRFLKDRIFVPLEMSHTIVYDTTRPRLPARALGFNSSGVLDDYNAYTTGGGGIFSNVKDLYAWVRALDKERILKMDKMEEAYRPVALPNDSTSWYGFGWMLDKKRPEIVMHSGSLVGYRTYLYRDRKTGTVVILLSNHSNNVKRLNEEIVALLP
ncbi:MAG: beta-lactamase family protein [Cyclobacteriaceae bacterium]|nr:beta-lactamase family protein [Cyclobacteriaceae bacterium]